MNLDYIVLQLENCEDIKISGDDIGYILVDKIYESIFKVGSETVLTEIIEDFAIEIHKDANVKTRSKKVFDRLSEYKDIVSIIISLDGNENKFYLNWIDNGDYSNINQKTYESCLGNFYIVVSKTKEIDDYFDIDQINDNDYMVSFGYQYM